MLKEFVENKVNPILRKFGAAIVPCHKETSLQAALGRLKKQGVPVESVVDVGASYGKWSEVAMGYFPRARYHLIEAQDCHVEKLEHFVKAHKNASYVLAAGGDEPGELYFDATDPFGGLASKEPIEGDDKKVIRVPVTTIDAEVDKQELKGPYLLKLDTHGFEIPIFEGAQDTLDQTSVIIVEVYNFVLTDGAVRFHEMIDYLETKGFRVAGMCDPVFRNKDGILWQLDLVFTRADRAEYASDKF